jgi:AcrR family transcriptional regulator
MVIRRQPAPPEPNPDRPYHHGNLRRALIEAALDIATRRGAEHVSVREAARQVGVSPGAPFRHFPSRKALMTAVAEQANERLSLEASHALARAGAGGPARLRALGRAYLRWALRNPAHFRIVSARDQLDVAGSPSLVQGMLAVRHLTEQTLQQAQQAGEMPARHSAQQLALLARAAAYGLVRMHQDGHFPQWGVAAGREEAAMQACLDLLIGLMAEPAAPPVNPRPAAP